MQGIALKLSVFKHSCQPKIPKSGNTVHSEHTIKTYGRFYDLIIDKESLLNKLLFTSDVMLFGFSDPADPEESWDGCERLSEMEAKPERKSFQQNKNSVEKVSVYVQNLFHLKISS